MIEKNIKIGNLNKVMSGVNLLNNLADKKLAMSSKQLLQIFSYFSYFLINLTSFFLKP